MLKTLNYLFLLCISFAVPFILAAMFYLLTLRSFSYTQCVTNPAFVMVDFMSGIIIFFLLAYEYDNNKNNNKL